jgi:hypothetical protein
MNTPTAVEWLIEQMICQMDIRIENTTIGVQLLEQANQIFEQQIIDAFSEGAHDGYDGYGDENKEKYYNDTYKK